MEAKLAREFDIYVGCGDRPNADDLLLQLGGFALGIGMPGFSRFEAQGGWVSPTGEQIYDRVVVFRFLLPNSIEDFPWSIAAFSEQAKILMDQEAILVVERIAGVALR